MLQLKKVLANVENEKVASRNEVSTRSPISSRTQTMLKSIEMRQSRARLINDKSA